MAPMTVAELIDRLRAMVAADPDIGQAPLVVEQWQAVIGHAPDASVQDVHVLRVYFGGRDCRVVALRLP
jgi:hypothetical protein